jgi:hypothetical protein
MDTQCGRTLLARGCNISSSAALENTCPNMSMTKIKSISERGSPCLNPPPTTTTKPFILKQVGVGLALIHAYEKSFFRGYHSATLE